MFRAFGNKIRSYSFKKNISILSIICIASVLFFIIYYGINMYNKSSNKIGLVPLIIILFFSSIIFIIIIFIHVSNLTKRIDIYENGFVYFTFGFSKKYPIENIKSIYYDTFKYYTLSKKYLMTVGVKNMDVSLKILTFDNQKLVLKSEFVHNFESLNDDINYVFNKYNMPKLNDMLSEDKMVDFGEISISNESYICDDNIIKFTDIKELYIENSIFHIISKNDLSITKSIRKISNLFLMIDFSRKFFIDKE